jgi:hypothetical protein
MPTPRRRPTALLSRRARPVRHRRPFARAAPDGKPEALIVNAPAPSRSSRRWCRSARPAARSRGPACAGRGALGSACWGAGTSASRSARRLPVRAASPAELGAGTRGRAAAHGRPRQPRVQDRRRAPHRRPLDRRGRVDELRISPVGEPLVSSRRIRRGAVAKRPWRAPPEECSFPLGSERLVSCAVASLSCCKFAAAQVPCRRSV